MISKIKFFIFIAFVSATNLLVSQTIQIEGHIQSKVDIENIHVINKTANLFTVTDKFGGFKIHVKIMDTLMFTSVQHKTKIIQIDESILINKTLNVFLEEQINELDEVTVGKVLTGNLLLDINNIKGEPPINFFDVGIPGYTGRPATQSERRLSEAGEFKPKMLLGLLGGGLPLNPILNGISGRTKMLKQRVEIEEKEALMYSIKARLSKDFLMSNPLEEDFVMDFFYFCADDENFIKHCKNQTDFKILIFLRMKYRQYLENIKEKKD
ncbi:MAG: carboxypeptidase-like regulatory domain-containing protein [Flavobacteriaceae bacterium]|jgi:hypothetical protein|nr:carboxypeptidase-like regulatory domain-containing protein [Flavobacteriaceae bacterium]